MTQTPPHASTASLTAGETQTNVRVLVRDLILDAEIGAYAEERGRTQKVCFNLALDLGDIELNHGDAHDKVVCYDAIITTIKSILGKGHINLVETLAEKILDALFEDDRVQTIELRVEKLEAVSEAAAVGVELTRTRT